MFIALGWGFLSIEESEIFILEEKWVKYVKLQKNRSKNPGVASKSLFEVGNVK